MCFLCLQYKMRDKIIQLVWDLTIPADAPPELLGLRTMERVIQSYHSSERVSDQLGVRGPSH